MSRPLSPQEFERRWRLQGWLPLDEMAAFMGVTSRVLRDAFNNGWVETCKVNGRVWGKPVQRLGGEDLIRMTDAVRRLQE